MEDDDEFFQLEARGDRRRAESSEVVLVDVADLSDAAVNMEALEESGHLPTAVPG